MTHDVTNLSVTIPEGLSNGETGTEECQSGLIVFSQGRPRVEPVAVVVLSLFGNHRDWVQRRT
jgi:hypothetical protein